MPDNNIIVNSTFSNILEWELLASKPDPEFTYQSCNFWNNGDSFEVPTGMSEMPPEYVAPEDSNLRLRETSPLRDAGEDLNENRYDAEGMERLSGSYSIGAFELD